ncbi:MAG TPA: DUF6152 family protein [Candidatus Acidoferrum sp.]|nr:DUF6152 family protein [Candidatus Acidoferrum sp.]
MTKFIRCLGALALLQALACFSPAVLAHHSFAMYDMEHQQKFSGKVTSFTWTNPHVYIEMDSVDAKGKPKHWTIECANISILGRIGWTFNMVKPGDTITVIVAPLHTGQPGALLKQIQLPDGRKMGNGAPAGPPDPKLAGDEPAAETKK